MIVQEVAVTAMGENFIFVVNDTKEEDSEYCVDTTLPYAIFVDSLTNFKVVPAMETMLKDIITGIPICMEARKPFYIKVK